MREKREREKKEGGRTEKEKRKERERRKKMPPPKNCLTHDFGTIGNSFQVKKKSIFSMFEIASNHCHLTLFSLFKKDFQEQKK